MQIHSTDSFKNEFLKLDVNLLYRATILTMHKNRILRDFNITWQQYNILSILRIYHPKSMNLMSISDQMIDPASNTSRLVEKLRQKGLVERIENEHDRRKVDINITMQGLEILQLAGQSLEQNTLEILNVINEDEARLVNDILDKID